ncbi:hypothetical protein QW060_20455 [Myroides ceti]|uniref:NADH dehydrogenase subunit 6 n=1 Tax=Paenimyroides ceti TaxID=395087 RepID=A0ABT8D0A3_9FLAO|nr:hypothetical protein [Paenimyroides ceti]MDN3708654.1 hypothetical protein [Paenimyroides ceti]MDN3709115.1 hypothetical protein [Paenimyroides ceti]MDN3709385.1 hypothetical protein [Paenimyroides ceti]
MRRHKKIIICWLIGVIIILTFSYISGLQDDVYIEQYYEGVWYKDVLSSIKYFLLWVLPYWWLIIILIGSLLGIIIFLVTLLLGHIKSKTEY